MSFQQGISGLNATSKNLEVIGNNIANANTFGAKVARAEFGDVYAAALNGTGATMAGIGTNLTVVAQQFTQGNITTTENPLDLAINGNGFFQLSDALTPVTYTRNGQFKVDRDGFIVSNAGRKLMGYAADASGVIQTGQSAPLQLPTAGIAPVPTSAIDIDMNLDSRKAVTFTGATPAIEFDDAATYNNATSATVFDAKGQEIALTLFFQKSANDTWHVYATANGTMWPARRRHPSRSRPSPMRPTARPRRRPPRRSSSTSRRCSMPREPRRCRSSARRSTCGRPPSTARRSPCPT